MTTSAILTYLFRSEFALLISYIRSCRVQRSKDQIAGALAVAEIAVEK